MRGGVCGSLGDFLELVGGGGGDALLFGGGECAPRLPVEAEDLVQHGGAFDGEGDCGSFSQDGFPLVLRIRQGDRE